jgi:predicted ATPase
MRPGPASGRQSRGAGVRCPFAKTLALGTGRAVIAQVVSPVMIGRDAELARLEEALFAAHAGDSRLLVLSGDAGVGKSRLVSELRRRASAMGSTVLVGECSEADLALPYLPFVEAIGNLLASREVDADRVRSALGSEVAPLARLLPQLGATDVSFNPTATSLDKLRLFEAIVALLQTLATENGLLLVIEDIHWADQSTQELLDYLTRRLRRTRTVTLVTHRSFELDHRHPLLPTVQRWRRAGISETITLQPLDVDGVSAMVAAIFDLEEAPPDFARSLHERSEGLPFAVEELLRNAVDRGTISRERWDDVALTTMPLPRTLTDNILVRVERLAPEHAEVVRAASVLGRSFDFSNLARLAELADAEVTSALAASIGEQLLEEDGQRDHAYRFRHALIRDAIYSDMIAARRRLLHGRAADVMRSAKTVSPSELAAHLIAAGRHAEAAPVCAEAGEDAMRRLAPHEACDLFARAITHTAGAPERARLLCRLGEAWRLAGDVAAAQQYLEEGVVALEAAGDAVQASQFRLSLGRCYWERSNGAGERDQYRRAIDVLERLGPSEDLANAYMRLSSFHSRQLEGAEAQRLAERAIDIADAAGLVETGIASSTRASPSLGAARTMLASMVCPSLKRASSATPSTSCRRTGRLLRPRRSSIAFACCRPTRGGVSSPPTTRAGCSSGQARSRQRRARQKRASAWRNDSEWTHRDHGVEPCFARCAPKWATSTRRVSCFRR